MSDKKRLIITIVSMLILVVGVTFAYFIPQIGGGVLRKLNLVADTPDDLQFIGGGIKLKLTQFNLAQGGENLSNSTYVSAVLKANSTTNTATYTYNVYFNVKSNNFIYTTTEKKAEIILKVLDPNGNEITTLDGLTYLDGSTTNGVSGFDITTLNGLKTIAENYTITSNSSNDYNYQDWNFSVTFINLDTNQVENEGKELKAEIIMQQDKLLTTLDEVCTNGDNLTNCITTLSQKSISGATNIYYHDSNLENGANDNSYRYAGPSDKVNNFICFGSTTSPCPTDNLYRIIGVIDGKVKLIKYDYMTTDELGTDGDYSGAYTNGNSTYKGNNYANIASYYWNYKADTTINNGYGSNTWSTGLFNKTNLNTNFINYLETEWSNKIATTTWKIGGNTWDNITKSIPSVAYQKEIVNPDATNTTDNATSYNAKIGLMYVSDYGFAASPSAWTTVLNNYDGYDANKTVITKTNWMYMGLYEWTLSRNSGYSYYVFSVDRNGKLIASSVNNIYAGRASFNLESFVTYKSGSGTMSDPIIIN